MLSFFIFHTGGVLRLDSQLPHSLKQRKKPLHASAYTMALPSSPGQVSSLELTLPCLCNSDFHLMAGRVHMSASCNIQMYACVYTPDPSLHTPPGFFCVCGMCIHVCSHVWGLEVDGRCICQLLSTLFTDPGSLAEPNVYQFN